MFLAVLDFEATCGDAGFDSSLQEIIELPVALVSLADARVVATFGTFVRPTRQPVLTAFCTELTGIRQSDVDGAPTILDAMAQLDVWLTEHDAHAALAATCGDWDLKQMWPRQLSLERRLVTPPLFRAWCNLKVPFQQVTKTKAKGMMGMLATLGLAHEGRHHRGADDVKNLCRIALELHRRGAELAVTASLNR